MPSLPPLANGSSIICSFVFCICTRITLTLCMCLVVCCFCLGLSWALASNRAWVSPLECTPKLVQTLRMDLFILILLRIHFKKLLLALQLALGNWAPCRLHLDLNLNGSFFLCHFWRNVHLFHFWWPVFAAPELWKDLISSAFTTKPARIWARTTELLKKTQQMHGVCCPGACFKKPVRIC